MLSLWSQAWRSQRIEVVVPAFHEFPAPSPLQSRTWSCWLCAGVQKWWARPSAHPRFSISWFHWSCTGSGRMGSGLAFVPSSHTFCLEMETDFVERQGAPAGVKLQLWSVQNHPESPKTTQSHHWWLPLCSGQLHGLQRAISVLTAGRELSALPGTLIPALRSHSHPKTDPGRRWESRWGQDDSSDKQPWGQGSNFWPQPHFKAQGFLCKGSSPHERAGCANSVKQS